MELEAKHEPRTQAPSTGARRRYRAPRRSTLALGLAVAALVCAVGGALGPAKHLRTRYSWPPRELPAGQPDRLWYTPLLLARHEPESISATLPCTLPPPLSRAHRPLTILATARDPARVGGLSLADTGRRLLVSVGDRLLADVALPSGRSGNDCAYRLAVEGGRWSFSGGGVSRGGDLDATPIVNGLFSGLDLRATARPAIEVTTFVHGSRSRSLQTALWSAAALAAVAALLLVAAPRRPRRPWAIMAARVRRGAAQAGVVDGVFAVAVLGWWLVGPAFFDDGWVIAGQRNFAEAGNFSSYYSSFGVTSSLQYWLQWPQHWLFQSSSALLLLRLPALLCLALTWALCRWIMSCSTARSPGRGRAPLWALLSAFVVGAFAWGMTLRPEPVIALLVTGVLACTVRFLERQTAAPLAIASVLVALALSAHPAGLVSLAPLLAAAPAVARWARARPAAAATIGTAGIALLGVLAVLGSDLEQLRSAASSLRTYGDETSGWRDELTRYELLSRPFSGAPLRREWVALAAFAVLAYLLRRRRDRPRGLLDLPAAGLGVALVLLIATPAKVAWHFGTLIGLAAVALATETARLREDARSSRGWHARPFVVLAAATVAVAWAWSPRNVWSDLDLQTLQWTLGFERRLTLAKVAAAAPVVLLVALGLIEFARRRGRRISEVPWRAASWTVPVIAVPLIAFTAGVIVADAAKTESWTLTRQNIDTLRGDLRCGLADDALVAAPSSMHAIAPIRSEGERSNASSAPPPPSDDLPSFTLGQAGRSAPARSAWFTLPSGRSIGFFVGGVPDSSDTLELEWGRVRGPQVESLDIEKVSADFGSDARPSLVPWRFFAAGDLPARPPAANAVRFLLRSDVAPGGVIALTPPVRYANARLVTLLKGSGSRPLVLPNLLTYVPCAHQPRLSEGAAEVPGLILAFRQSIWPLATGTSPFDGLFDLYHVRRLPLTDSPHPPADVAVYDVDRDIPGAGEARPDRTTLVS